MIATGVAIWTRFGNAYSNETYPWSQARQGHKGPHKILRPYGKFHVIKCRRKRSPLKSFHSRPLRGLSQSKPTRDPKRDDREAEGSEREEEASTKMGSTCRRSQGSYKVAARAEPRGTSAKGGRGTSRNGRQNAQPTWVPCTTRGEGRRTKTVRTTATAIGQDVQEHDSITAPWSDNYCAWQHYMGQEYIHINTAIGGNKKHQTQLQTGIQMYMYSRKTKKT